MLQFYLLLLRGELGPVTGGPALVRVEGSITQTRAIHEYRLEPRRRAVGTAYGLAIVTLLAGWGSGLLLARFVGRSPSWVTTGLQFIAAVVILGATLGVAGREIESWGGQTLPEKADRWLYRAMYMLGTYCLVVSLAWSSG